MAPQLELTLGARQPIRVFYVVVKNPIISIITITSQGLWSEEGRVNSQEASMEPRNSLQ